MALTASDNLTLGDILELKFGSELQTIQFLGHVNAFRPYGSADLHLSPNTLLEYDYATSRPDLRSEKGFDSSPSDLSESKIRESASSAMLLRSSGRITRKSACRSGWGTPTSSLPPFTIALATPF